MAGAKMLLHCMGDIYYAGLWFHFFDLQIQR